MYSHTSREPLDPARLSVYDVYTPASTAVAGAVPRPSVTAAIGAALAVPGRQLFLYGRTGTGKSTALGARLARDEFGHRTVRCTSDTSFASLLGSAIEHFGLAVGGDRSVALAQIAAELAARGEVVVIEDAHHLSPDDRHRLLDAMKVFSDLAQDHPALTLVAVAAVEDVDDFAEFALEHSSRIAQVRVPGMSPEELELIVRRGGRLMNVDVDEVAPAIASCSGGMPSIAHQLALSTFLEADILVPAPTAGTAVGVDAFERAVASVIGTTPRDTRRRVDEALAPTRGRRAVAAVLTALATTDADGAAIDELARVAPAPDGEYLPDVIESLTTAHRGAVLEHVGSDRVRFAEPGLHSYWSLLSRTPPSATGTMSALR